MNKREKAISELKKGKIILLYDGDKREGEVDLVIAAEHTTPDHIKTLRKDAGGLICLAITNQKAQNLELPFFTDLINSSKLITPELGCKKTAYGDKPAFSLPINSKQVYTGITDNDRALTINELAKTNSKDQFCNNFYTPGHVFLLIGSGIENRKGHTELSLELGKQAGFDSMVLCEMLGDKKALSKEDALNYAKKNSLIFIEAKEIIEELKIKSNY